MKYILAFLFVFQTLAYSQNEEKKALLKSIENTNSASEKMSLYLKLAKAYKNTQIDSSIYFAEKGYAISKQLNDNKEIAENAAVLGDLYVAENKFDKAKIYYTISVNHFKKTDKQYDYCQTTMILGHINFVQNNFVTAIQLYREAMTIANKQNYIDLKADLNNGMGSVYFEIDDYKEAEKYYRSAYKLFKQGGKKSNEIVALGNLLNIQQVQGKNNEVIKSSLKMIQIASKGDKWEDLVGAYRVIIGAYVRMNEYDKAEGYIKKAIDIIDKNKQHSPDYRGAFTLDIAIIYHDAAFIYNKKGELDKSLKYAHKSTKLTQTNSYKRYTYENARMLSEVFAKMKRWDSAFYYNTVFLKNYEEFNKESDSKEVTRLKMQDQFNYALKIKEIEDVKKHAASKRNELIYLGTSIFTILGIIIMILLFRNQRAKTAKLILNKEKLELEKTALNLEKTALNNDLDYKRKELTSNMMYLLAKNEFIISIAQKLKSLKPETDVENQKKIKQVIVELNQNSSLKIWEEFEIRFKEVHSDFYDKLNNLYPDLTPNEIKICAFLKLNMSTKDISAITHQSVKSITMARFRLRKKLNLETEDNLVNFMIQL